MTTPKNTASPSAPPTWVDDDILSVLFACQTGQITCRKALNKIEATIGRRIFMRRRLIEKGVIGALRSSIKAHGPITPQNIGSAAKRVAGAVVTAPRGGKSPNVQAHPRSVGGPTT